MKTTIADLQQAITDANLEPHAAVSVDSGEEIHSRLDVRRDNNELRIFTEPSNFQDKIDVLEQCIADADEAASDLEDYLFKLEDGKIPMDIYDTINSHLKNIREHLEA